MNPKIQQQQRKQSKNKSQFKAPYEDQQQNLLHQVMNLLQALFEMRLIQKISRPIDKKTKQDYINKFSQKIELLHIKLIKIRTQIVQNNSHSENGNYQRNKSVFGQATTKPDDWKKIIRSIENKYTQVLIDGSYKHFRKIIYFLGLSEGKSNMSLLNIQEWAGACLDNRGSASCC